MCPLFYDVAHDKTLATSGYNPTKVLFHFNTEALIHDNSNYKISDKVRHRHTFHNPYTVVLYINVTQLSYKNFIKIYLIKSLRKLWPKIFYFATHVLGDNFYKNDYFVMVFDIYSFWNVFSHQIKLGRFLYKFKNNPFYHIVKSRPDFHNPFSLQDLLTSP